MNASSNPLALIGHVSNGLLSTSVDIPGSPAQPPEGGEASFVDSLSAALAAPLALPVAQTADQVAAGGLLQAPLADGVVADNGSLLLGEGALDPARLSLSSGVEPKVAGDLSRSLVPALNPPTGQEQPGPQMTPSTASGDDVAQARTKPDLAENLQRQVGPKALPPTPLPQSYEPGRPANMPLNDDWTLPAVSPSAKGSSTSNAVAQARLTLVENSQASAIAIAATAPRRSAEVQPGPVLSQQRPILPAPADRLSIGGVNSNPVLRPVAERPFEASNTMSHVGHRPPLDQGVKTPVPHAPFGQQVRAPVTTSDAPLRPVKERGQVGSAPASKDTPALTIDRGVPTPAVNHSLAPTVKGMSAPAVENTPALAVKPVDPAALPTLDPAEPIDGAFRSNPAAVEAFGAETASLDPASATTSKPSVQPTQPPSTQIAMQIARAIPQGVDRFSIQLHPADLGMVEIRLEFAEEGRMSALITVERPETLELLQRDSRSLERTLSNAGLSLENGGLSFSLKQEQHQQEQGFNAPSHQQSQAFSNDHGRNGGGDESPDQKPILVSPQRLLDIRT